MYKNIILCGFMACGKTTVGRLLASRLGMRFVDMDARLEESFGLPVAEIFKNYGEPVFRDAEAALCVALSQERGVVIASGGGALADERNARTLRESGAIVFMDVTAETVLQRTRGDTTRPLLQKPDREKSVRTLMEKRLPVYQAVSDVAIDANRPACAVCADIANWAAAFFKD